MTKLNDKYDEKIRRHYNIELAKRGLSKQDVALGTKISYSMIVTALNGVCDVVNINWADNTRRNVDTFLENYDKKHKSGRE